MIKATGTFKGLAFDLHVACSLGLFLKDTLQKLKIFSWIKQQRDVKLAFVCHL